MKISELFEAVQVINNVKYDPISGIGSVGSHAMISTRTGIKILMRPSVFLSLATRISREDSGSIRQLESSITSGRPIAPPYLVIDSGDDEQGNEFPCSVTGNAGIDRVYAINELYGDIPMLVYIYYSGRHIAAQLLPTIEAKMNKVLISQNNQKLNGPFFKKI